MIVRRFADLEFSELPGRLSADPFAGVDPSGTSVRIVRIEGASPRSPHRHPRSAEAVYVAEGSGRAWQDGEVRRVTAGDTVLVPRGVPHATIPDPGGSLLLVCFFPDPDLATNLEELDAVLDLDG
ncbi:MAG: cupin domain-containing protein [Streptosporangiales bacterium]|nr:cupin domain-containing protein [Streptosporangiales bacterium]